MPGLLPVDDRSRRLTGLVLSVVLVELTLTTAYIHLGLGGLLFTLNGVGYVALALAVGVTALAGSRLVSMLAAVVRIGLATYALATIAGYLLMGPYLALGWIAKAVEVTIVTLVIADVVLVRWRARPDSNRRSPA